MIRPFTIVTFMLACGSGLYLYQSKHEVQMLDKNINQAQRDISVLRDQSRLLANDWTMLNEPERLRKFADLYLSLRQTLPSQYASLADLDTRLPPVRTEAPSGTVEGDTSAMAEPDAITTGIAPPAGAGSALPVPPAPAAPPPAPAPRPAEHKVVAGKPAGAESAPPRPAAAGDQHAAETRAPRPADHAGDLRPVELHPPAPAPLRTAAAPPRPLPTNPSPLLPVNPPPPLPANPPPAARAPQAALSPQPAPNAGSLLGMARGAASLPAPRPMPINATNWYNAN